MGQVYLPVTQANLTASHISCTLRSVAALNIGSTKNHLSTARDVQRLGDASEQLQTGESLLEDFFCPNMLQN
jgi:hypothetical protein